MELFNLHFLNPIFLYIFPFILVLFLAYNYFNNKKSSINIGFYDDLKEVYKFSSFYYYLKIFIISLILLCFFILFANPHKINAIENIKKNGIDIVLVLDISKSMEAEDLKPNRMESAKSVILDFIDNFKTDRVGLVIFAGKPFSSIPLTFDYDILKESIGVLNTDSLNQNVPGFNGTAVGDAMLLSKNLFKKDSGEQEREKVVILLTDGDANRGVDPLISAKILKDDAIKVYTIGIGSKQGGFITYNIGHFVQKQQIAPLNEKYLKQIADITSGEFYRATDNESLKNIFKDLESLEKNDIEVKIKKTYIEYYKPFVYGLIFLLFSLLLLETYIIRK